MTPATWTDWPARRSPGRAALAAAIIAAAVGVVATVDPLLAVLSGALLLGATAEVLLPTRYTLAEEGIETTSLLGRRARPWEGLGAWRKAGADFAVEGRSAARILRRHRSVRLRAPQEPELVSGWLEARLGPMTEV